MAGMEGLSGLYDGLKARMNGSVDDFRANLVSVRTGRASVHMLDGIKVDYYGTETPISQVAQVTTPEANLILVQPWEQNLVPMIDKAIRTSQHGFNPMHDGKIIRVPVPPMTEERREKRANAEIQELTDAEIKRLEEFFRAKEKEVMTV